MLITSLSLIISGWAALSFGPNKPFFGVTISYLLLVTGRFLIAIGSYGVSINGYLLGEKIIVFKTNFLFIYYLF